jgi:hypothetical protein
MSGLSFRPVQLAATSLMLARAQQHSREKRPDTGNRNVDIRAKNSPDHPNTHAQISFFDSAMMKA